MNNIGIIIGVFKIAKVTPTANASILVAIANNVNSLKENLSLEIFV
ncbi:hypothetical protein SDC9_21242 [bioreactor metagenome]|uniref:Uncharacterized protein n=1 Tax=bioreactor metagenome TaxID=1076179 RepID=A0A644U8Z3_9ZZZZ